MPFFVARFEHPDETGRRQQLRAHLAWLRVCVVDGSVRASGPLVGAPDRAAMLVMTAPDRATLEAVITTDPFAVHGLIESMMLAEWDPIFGA